MVARFAQTLSQAANPAKSPGRPGGPAMRGGPSGLVAAPLRYMRTPPRALAFIVTFLLMTHPGTARSQGFAGLGTGGEGFRMPDPAAELSFPADHGAHPEFRIEWWYVTANLTGDDGQAFGLQWTLFRTALAPYETSDWDSPQLWMGHAAITTSTAHFTAEKLARGGIGQAGAKAEPFEVWIDDWSLQGSDIDALRLTAGDAHFSYALDLVAEGPIVLQGDQGYSVKSPTGQASHYYSQPFFQASGTLTLPDGTVQVSGQAWADREWSSELLAEDQSGWDWFSLHLDSGAKLMGFRLRGDRDFSAATWIAPDGTPAAYPDGDLITRPLETATVAGREVPVSWQIELADRGFSATIKALNDQSWNETLVPYWEGPVTVSGSHGGRGYLEMTGYD